jgi:hypothetical protein
VPASGDIAEIQAKLGNVSFESSHQLEVLDICKWRGAGLTGVVNDRPFFFAIRKHCI